MGKEQSKLTQEGYVVSKKTESGITATKDDDAYFIKMIHLTELPRQALAALMSEIEVLRQTNHPHLTNIRNSFKDENQNIYYIILKECQGGSLADVVGKNPEELPQESEVLSWIVEICMALKVIHEANLLHKDLMPKNILLSEFGLVHLGGFGNIHESSKGQSATNSNPTINYLAPEVFTGGTYDGKSDIWSLGCILYELCTKQKAFSAETTIKLMPKIISGVYQSLPSHFSFELCDLLSDLLKKEPEERPTASEILLRPIIIRCLRTKCQTTVEDLQMKLEKLRALADGLERVHEGTTIGSLTGGVIGAVGGITSIVGLILAPFTLGVSLIVTGVGVGVGAVGGVTAGASNITKMVNQSSDRKAVRSIIKEIEQKISAVVTWLLEINSGMQAIKNQCPQAPGTFTEENLTSVGTRVGKGLGGIAELVRLVRVANIGKLAAQTCRVVRLAEVATGVLSGLFVAVDIFFIALDAKEIQHIKEAREAEKRIEPPSASESETGDSMSVSDQATLLSSSLMQESDNGESDLVAEEVSSPPTETKSEIMKFVKSVRKAANNLEQVLGELATIISSIPLFQEDNDLEWQNMEFK
ncbi:calcium/calmodulin-dependent protein kinase type II subunit beta-like [Xiphophorus couchianus]|uniref:calcium/calmodulin-dependent protein kinase type II subunit beta-like n=1 Tax=Xiphophorus couchianus TaxID=32473 RepID=UPI0010162BDE|nr:calcium/calmodulin-dependent protein kinase type II subunit beta-like [Xiphophorus couchianus]XP_027865574.1 calcium/calmodulin-dependent protein kinase type II subunit beta-like [Xiphophorus couchianus]